MHIQKAFYNLPTTAFGRGGGGVVGGGGWGGVIKLSPRFVTIFGLFMLTTIFTGSEH